MANVGMFHVQSDRDNLQADINSIYQGVAGNSYTACNRIQSYQKKQIEYINDREIVISENGYGE